MHTRHLILGAVVLAAAACSKNGSAGDGRSVTSLDKPVWTHAADNVVGTAPMLDVVVNRGVVAVLQPDAGRVLGLDLLTGRGRWKMGGTRGNAPEQLSLPTSLYALPGGGVGVVDFANTRATLIDGLGALAGHLSGEVLQLDVHNVCATEGTLGVAIQRPQLEFVRWDSTGRVLLRQPVIWTDSTLNGSIESRDALFAHARTPTCVVVSRKGNYFFTLDVTSLARGTVYPFKSPVTGGVFTSLGAAVDGDSLFVLLGGDEKRAGRLVDVYRVTTGAYVRTYELPEQAYALDVAEGRLVALTTAKDAKSKVVAFALPTTP